MPTFTVRRDANGHACAIERDGKTILQLAIGAERNEENADAVVAALNEGVSANTLILRRRDKLMEALRRIADSDLNAKDVIGCYDPNKAEELQEIAIAAIADTEPQTGTPA